MNRPSPCKSIGCTFLADAHDDFCAVCVQGSLIPEASDNIPDTEEQIPLFLRYPDDYKPVGNCTHIDTHAVHQFFNIKDPSGCIQHASRKLLMSGNAEHTVYQDILEARDTLTRWLQLNQGTL